MGCFMTSLLIKIFIKDYKNIKNQNVRKHYGMLASFVGIFTNTFLFLIKFAFGLFSNSIVIIIDAFNNLSDFLSSIISLIGFKLALKPPDKAHPFGHGRIEYVTGLIIAFIILLAGIEFLKSTIYKIFNPSPLYFSILTITILLITILIKLWLYLFNKKLSKIVNSKALLAAAIDCKNDMLITFVTVISLLLFKFFGLNLDSYLGIILSLFLLYSGYLLAKETLSPILGEAVDGALAQKLKNIALSFKEVLGVHDIIVHNYGINTNMASLHAEVSSSLDLNTAHEIADKIENKVKNDLSIFLTVHIDPIDINDKRLKALIDILKGIFSSYDYNIQSHDHRLVDSENYTNFIFDLVLPFDFPKNSQKELLIKIKQNISNLDKKYNCIINIEQSFIGK